MELNASARSDITEDDKSEIGRKWAINLAQKWSEDRAKMEENRRKWGKNGTKMRPTERKTGRKGCKKWGERLKAVKMRRNN